MNLGVYIFDTDYSIRIDELAKAVEERGFESLWVPEHTHIPTSRRTPYPAGGDLPREYSHTHDPFVSLAVAAACTRTLKLGTGICLVIERDTITTAKAVASLDSVSDGRFLFGIGAGWNAEEMENHGTVFKTRFKRLREQILAMKELWTRDEAQYHGDFVDFDSVWSWPKPVQRPHPPVLLGGSGTYTLKRVAEFCDGWLPIGFSTDAVLKGMEELKGYAEEAGRDPQGLSVTVYGTRPASETLERYAAAGVERCVLTLPPEGRETVLPLLDQWAQLRS